MSDLNAYSFTGRLGSPAEVKYTQGGKAIWSARVAVGYGYGENKGTNWITIQAFGNRAEALGKLDLPKGAAIGATGELRIREYEARDGGKGVSHEVIVSDVALLGGRPEGSAGHGGSRGGAPQRERPARATDGPRDDFVDSSDIPFGTNRSAW